jgi:long-subunit acyl-CoA synthetase (AMP-forming)
MHLIFDALARHARETPDAPAVRAGDVSLTWGKFARRVAQAAEGFARGPRTVGLALSGIEYAIGDLGATLAGCRVVPVPAFFSPGQRQHLLSDAEATLIETLPRGAAEALPDYRGGAERVIYTSGTTGTPKGVVLGDRQITASIEGLAAALRPTAADRYLSALPRSQLLEQICGVFLPVLAGAEAVTCPEGLAALMGGDGPAFAQAAARLDPTITVLAPRQLALWVAALEAGEAVAPRGLRYIAVGGAPVTPRLIEAAHRLGLPAAEGYGLSEACSVVALTPPEAVFPGGGMRPVAGITVEIEAGEIVVSGPTVMNGYLGAPGAPARWHTGDLGRIDGGRLWVEGRRDALIVRASGRNISPEWVEAAALADPAILAAALVDVEEALVLLLAPTRTPDLTGLAARLEDLPEYARPTHFMIADPRTAGLIRASGTADRRTAAAVVADNPVAWCPFRTSARARGERIGA